VDIDAQAARDSTASDTWRMGVGRLAVANGPNIFRMLLVRTKLRTPASPISFCTDRCSGPCRALGSLCECYVHDCKVASVTKGKLRKIGLRCTYVAASNDGLHPKYAVFKQTVNA